MKKQVPLTPVLAVALAIVIAVGYFALVRPKQAQGAELDAEIAELETNLAAARPAAAPASPKVRINVADVFRLAKAMPDNDDMPGIILELNAVAVSAGVEFMSIQPLPPLPRGAYDALPTTLTFEGNYYDLTDFLYRLRNLVTVRDGVLHATGRLYTLDALDLHEAEAGFPQIQAVLTVSAYSFGTTSAPASAPGQPGTTGTTTTQPSTTGTTTTGTTTASNDAAEAATGGTG